MTKSKNLLILLAALAVGTTAAAGVTLFVGSSNGYTPVYASTAEEELDELEVGAHTLTLEADEPYTFAIKANEAGNYGFELPYSYVLVSGTEGEDDAVYEKVYDEFSATITVTVDGDVYTLDYDNPEVVVELSDPSGKEVTLVSDEDVTFVLHLTYDYNYAYIDMETETSLYLAANTYNYAIVRSKAAGYYTFTASSSMDGTATFEFVNTEYSNGEWITVTSYYDLSAEGTFTVYLASPSGTIIPVISEEGATAIFTVTYSENDPDAVTGDNTLAIGTQTVSADGEGIAYTFTSEEDGYYTLICTDSNAYLMVEGEYWVEWIEAPYTFYLEEGETITFLMATDDWSDDEYEVEIVTAVVVGTQTVNANYDGIAYVFTSEDGGTYTLACTDSNAYIMVEDANSVEWVETPYTFTLGKGESITFLMATNARGDATYEVTISEAVEE